MPAVVANHLLRGADQNRSFAQAVCCGGLPQIVVKDRGTESYIILTSNSI